MMTLRQCADTPEHIHTATMWYLTDLAEARGKQGLYTKQFPQKLKALREHAMIESAVSSNRIEGVEVDQSRVGTIMFGRPRLRDRNEIELQGYRSALNKIHQRGAELPVSERTIRELHRLTRGEIWDAGRYKQKDADIIETYPDGGRRVRFRTVPADKTPHAMSELVELWHACLRERWVHPLVGLAAFNLDFLCIHPFRDGNGRVSRLLLLLLCYHLGLEVGRYISLERLIEQNKERYYETLEQSSHGWHQGKHDPWCYVNYVLFILKTAYKEFEDRLGQAASPKGAKADLVIDAIHRQSGAFRLVDIERACPGVGREWIRVLLSELRRGGEVECRGKGPAARWWFVRKSK